jgi:hypothetical protein
VSREKEGIQGNLKRGAWGRASSSKGARRARFSQSALVADFRAADDANFTRLGIDHGFGLTETLPRLVGIRRAGCLIYTGEQVSGARAWPARSTPRRRWPRFPRRWTMRTPSRSG